MTKNSANTTSNATQATQLEQFEASVAELEQLVEQLESGDTSLSDALQKFERGVRLARQCRDQLKHAELRVEQVLADGQTAELSSPTQTFEAQDTTAAEQPNTSPFGGDIPF